MLLQVIAAVVAVICAISVFWRRYTTSKIQQLDPKKDCEKIARLLCCYEFPFEWYYGINIAFYRTFASPTIAGVYYKSRTIEHTTEKRVTDTDIIMFQAIENGVNSENGKRAMEHLNDIHRVFEKQTIPRDFVYVLCCFLKDTITVTNLLGYRKVTQVEKEGMFHFWIKYGEAMKLQDMPRTFDEAIKLVDDYTESDKLAKTTKGGTALSEAITSLLARWFWPAPHFLVKHLITALLYVVGGPTFVDKCGYKQPYQVLVYLLYILGYVRGVLWNVVPPRLTAFNLSEHEFNKYYTGKSGCPMAKNFIDKVGPVDVLRKIEEEKSD